MSTREAPTETGESFQQRLHKLRIQIDTLPEAQRPRLYDWAETIARQHRQLQHATPRRNSAD